MVEAVLKDGSTCSKRHQLPLSYLLSPELLVEPMHETWGLEGNGHTSSRSMSLIHLLFAATAMLRRHL